ITTSLTTVSYQSQSSIIRRPQTAGYSVVGFAICDADDEDMRISFLESATAGNLEEISIYREPAA
ncbi:hypothetical protein NO263_03465, partial [Gluconacetobacter entanii]